MPSAAVSHSVLAEDEDEDEDEEEKEEEEDGAEQAVEVSKASHREEAIFWSSHRSKIKSAGLCRAGQGWPREAKCSAQP